MNRIEEMLQEMCPEGVEFKKLPAICNLARGKVYSKTYLIENKGDYPVYSSQTTNNGELGRISTYDYDGEFLTWTTDGAYAGTIFHRKGKFSITNVCGIISLKSKDVLIRFLYYWLSIEAPKYVYQGMGNPKLMSNQMENIEIPIPPLPIQKEIVRILDHFTELATKLQAELQARQEQYEYYRNKLLTFNETGDETQDVRWMKMSEIGTFTRGSGLQKKDFTESGVGCIHYGQIYTYYGTSATETLTYCSEKLAKRLKTAHKGDIIIATTSENVEDVCKAVAWLGNNDIVVSGDSYIFSHKQNPKYISYLFQTPSFFKFKQKNSTGTKVIRVSGDSMAKFEVPIPPLPIQEKIVGILDKFETLVNDLSQGLPAEIAAVQEQYEYYRNKLLSFNHIKSN